MKSELSGIMASLAGEPAIILTDMYGGSAFMASVPFASGKDRMLVAGVNMPLLLDLLVARDTDDFAALKETVQANKEKYLVLYQEPKK